MPLFIITAVLIARLSGLILGIYWFGWWFLVPAMLLGINTHISFKLK